MMITIIGIHISGSNAREDILNDFRDFGPLILLWKFLKDLGRLQVGANGVSEREGRRPA